MLGDTIGPSGDGYVFVIHAQGLLEPTDINDLHVHAVDPIGNTYTIKILTGLLVYLLSSSG